MMGGVIYLAAAVALAALAAYFGLVGIPYQPDVMSAGTRLVGALFVITVFVERSTAVLNSIWYGEARRLAEAHEALQMQRWLTTIATPGESPPAALVAAINALATIESQQDRTRLIAGFIMAFIVRAAGASTLESLQTLLGALSPFQLGLYHTTDIILTAGLIAGGSNGIHAIADLLGSYVRVTRRRLMRSAP
ncbi:MAG: hypothetical protein QOK29_2779 [Rhodospirillaceae bacterium]|nr:hypothetical protein [Rhodospirillaceae bacterium]